MHHLFPQLPNHLFAVALDDLDGLVDIFLILFRCDESAARRGALLDLVLHARTVVVAQDFAGAQREHVIEELKKHIHLTHRRIGTEKMHFGGFGTARGEDSRNRLLRHRDPRVGFVVLQHDVVLGLKLLDHAVFQQQSIPFAIHHHRLDVADFRHQHPYFG